MPYNRQLGQHGEDLACRYLEKKGYRIRERNWRSRAGEIDIVAEKNGVFIFVEVKMRSSSGFGHPEEAVTATKRQHLIRATQWYCEGKRIASLCRIDVIAITLLPEGGEEIIHFEDITGP